MFKNFGTNNKQKNLAEPPEKIIMNFSQNRGLINDSISDMLTRIRNATLAKKSNVNIPFTNLNQELAQILEKEGFIQSFQIAVDSNDIVIRLKYILFNRTIF